MFFSSIGQGICDIFQMTRGNTVIFLTADGVSFHIMQKKLKKSHKKMKNGVCINPDTDDEKNKYEEVNAQKVAENLGAELQSLKIEDADGKVAYEVVDLVKPDPIKEENFLQRAIGRVRSIGSGIVKKYQETEAKKKEFRDNNPGGTITQQNYKNKVNSGTSAY